MRVPAGALAPLPKGGRVTPLLLRYAGGVQEDIRILGGVPPRAAVAFWTICTALLSLKAVVVLVVWPWFWYQFPRRRMSRPESTNSTWKMSSVRPASRFD